MAKQSESAARVFSSLPEALEYERQTNAGRAGKDSNRPKTYDVTIPAQQEQRVFAVARNPVDAVLIVAEERAGITAQRHGIKEAEESVAFMTEAELARLEAAIRKARGK